MPPKQSFRKKAQIAWDKTENTVSRIGLIFAFILLIITITTAAYTGYSHLRITKEIALRNEAIKHGASSSLDIPEHTNLVLELFGVHRSEFEAEDYEKLITFYFHMCLLLSGIFSTFAALFGYRRFKKSLKKNQSIQVYPINNSDHEDLRIMLKYYKSADYVTVYSGDFSWIKENPELQNVVLSLANTSKIKLYSNKNRAVVAGKIGEDILNELETNDLIKFERHIESNLRCSLIEHSGELTFIYKVKTSDPPEGYKYHLCILTEKMDSKYLLKILQGLITNH